MNSSEMLEYIKRGSLDSRLLEIYPTEALDSVRDRYIRALSEFTALYGEDREVSLFSVPGRSELSGNHTDHNRGCVIAASVNLDIIAVVAKRDDLTVNLKSEGFPEDSVDVSTYTAPISARFGSSASIIAGVCDGFTKSGYKVGGFDAYTTSNVPGGSGLSSSAAFENMIGTILSHTYNAGSISGVEIAKISQYAENVFFGKPCGLMDQIACAVGGIVAIDFEDPSAPIVEPIPFDISDAGYALCIVSTGGSHADLTDDYAAIPAEMKAAAGALGAEVLRDTTEAELISALPALRVKLGDRAILRALHFFEENRRVEKQKQALSNGDLEAFLELVRESGRSSFCYLQNVYTTKNPHEQCVSLALCLAEIHLKDKRAAWRVHGGGFAGTIQVLLPKDEAEAFKNMIDDALGKEKAKILHVRSSGASKVI